MRYSRETTMIKMRQPKTLRDILLENQKAERDMAAMCGKPLRADMAKIPDKRKQNKVTPEEDLEAGVISEVGQMLAIHPDVLFAVRQNSGASLNENGAYVWFYRFVTVREKMRMSDYWGMLKSGRMFALECKRRNWKAPSGQREWEQENFINKVKSHKGRAGFVRGAEEAMAVLEGL